ncbi:MAG: Paraquat-inducible protein A [uncultured Sulfurovum sp.]|uniref:Paraquat-inducible protein A n=1 Tax=uncultured Sulfurovum sp. TaxID=269237 RepID=A0A6S6T5W0_9BACT|nr:MAG: Paraquat-inducible protein A [uncultured Sulfurovum sp.]
MNFGYFMLKLTDTKMNNEHLIRCHICETVNYDNALTSECRRCHTKIRASLRCSYNKTLAFLITAIILYIPANLYPILITKQFGMNSESTILGGIIHLWELGSYPIALIILVASVVVPLLKFLLITYLLITSKHQTHSSSLDKHKLLYITESIGPWSMVDVFVVVILSVLIHFSGIQIYPGTAATAFALMVFFTMLSALSFDTRLIVNHNKKSNYKKGKALHAS